MQVPAPWAIRLEISCAGQGGLVRGSEIRRATKKPRDVLRKHIQHFAGGFAARDAFGVGGENGEIAVPSGGKLAALNLVDLGSELGILGSIFFKESGPVVPCGSAACAHSLRKVAIDSIGHEELRVFGPSVIALGEADFFLTGRSPVRGCGALLIR